MTDAPFRPWDWQVVCGIVRTPEFEALKPMIRQAMQAKDGDWEGHQPMHAYAKALIAMCWSQGYDVERPKLERLSHGELMHLFFHVLYLVQWHSGIWDDDDPLPEPIYPAAGEVQA